MRLFFKPLKLKIDFEGEAFSVGGKPSLDTVEVHRIAHDQIPATVSMINYHGDLHRAPAVIFYPNTYDLLLIKIIIITEYQKRTGKETPAKQFFGRMNCLNLNNAATADKTVV